MVIDVSSKEIILNNNCSISVGDGPEDGEIVYINCPKLEDDNVYGNTNSSFIKMEKVVEYKWPKTRGVNWLTVHRSKPYIAYAIQPDFQDVSRRNKTLEELDVRRQCVRIHNYHNQKRGLIKPNFTSTIAELAFAYIAMSVKSENRLAIIDRFANVQIHEFSCPDDEGNMLDTVRLLEIVSEVKSPFSEVRLAWCPGYIIDDEDLGMNLAISYDNCIEVYNVGLFIDRGIGRVAKEELDSSAPERKLVKESGTEPIISISLSNDLQMICAASKDNRVRFYQIEDEEVRHVHTWEPKMAPNSNLSCIFFLDDFNELLKNQESGIWGHILVGTSDGEITIWESHSWQPVQKIVLDCHDDEIDTDIEYRIDISSHVIIAIHGKSAFLLHLEFSDADRDKANHTFSGSDLDNDEAKGLLIKQPKIKKITRFQLYNPIISLAIKRPILSEIEIFWLTQKSLEKCLIDTESLIVDENTENSFLSRFNLSNMAKDYEKKRSPLYPSMGSINGDGDETKSNNTSSRLSLKTFEATPPVTLAEMFTNISTISESGTSGLTGVSTTNSKSDLKGAHMGSFSLLNDSINQRSTSPTSREVANYLGDESVFSRNQNSKIMDTLLRYDTHGDINVQSKILNIDPRIQHSSVSSLPSLPTIPTIPSIPSIPSVPYEPLPKDLATESMLQTLETRLLAHFDVKTDNMKAEICKLTDDIATLRCEMKDPSQFKASNKIVDTLIKKLMTQINQTFAKGLDEFIGQIRTEISVTSTILSQSRNDFSSHCLSVEKQFKQYEAQICELRKQMAECSKQQAEMVNQLRLQQQQMAASISPSPILHHNRNQQIIGNTPTPGRHENPFSPMILYQSEEEKRKKAELERQTRLQQMWAKIKSDSRDLMIEGICQAFEMKDPALINQICDHFRATKGTSYLVDLIAHDQALLLSILSTLASADLKEEKWKIPFIASIVPKLDIKSPLVKDWLPRFENKLISRLEEAHKVLGDQARDIPLVLTVLGLIRNR